MKRIERETKELTWFEKIAQKMFAGDCKSLGNNVQSIIRMHDSIWNDVTQKR